jgi:hypothetical protein
MGLPFFMARKERGPVRPFTRLPVIASNGLTGQRVNGLTGTETDGFHVG